MKAPDFFYSRDSSFLLSLALSPLTVASWFYWAGASLHSYLYKKRILNPRRLGCKVISVGSPMVGGTGKTPLAAQVADILRSAGYRVALASRGYGGKSKAGVTLVSDGQRILENASHVGDEPLVLAAHAPGVPVLIARDRGLAGLRAISDFDTEVLILDDGFNHHRLVRDLEVVTLDGGMGLGNGYCLPRGPLRTPVSHLSRADVEVLVDDPMLADVEKERPQRNAKPPQFSAIRRAEALDSLSGEGSVTCSWLNGKRVGIFSGIAYPDSFERMLSSLGARVVVRKDFSDHYRYQSKDFSDPSMTEILWITTEKDAVKIDQDWVSHLNIFVLKMELELEVGFSDWLVETVARPIDPSQS